MTSDPGDPVQAADAAAAPARPVVVGVDGSAAGDAAARWAADEAALRDLPLHVFHAMPPFAPGAFPTALVTASIDWEARAQTLLSAAIEPLRRRHPDLAIEGRAAIGRHPAAALTDEVPTEFLVVGSRGGGGFADLLLGSTAIQVLERATVPVVVVRPPSPAEDPPAADGPVVVGVDGSDPARRALRFAFTEAATRRTGLVVVHAWAVPDHPGLTSMRASAGADWSFLARHAEEVLHEAVAAVRGDFPDVEVTEHLVDQRPVPALLEASRRAQMLVLGSRGRGTLSGLVLGSVSHSAVRAASCPVAVVR